MSSKKKQRTLFGWVATKECSGNKKGKQKKGDIHEQVDGVNVEMCALDDSGVGSSQKSSNATTPSKEMTEEEIMARRLGR